ncbi:MULTISPECIES: DoxX family protein [Kordiimonas]|jgi:putative oxidoreductase|uniref:DoxX family protein n=1 Tax=Kordiimonas TaxID=288021 RepID=UPI002580BBE6|nr:DoxX family protein [Kordiimonas sp. UBA4487]
MDNLLSKFDPFAAPLGRLFLSIIFIGAGFAKVASGGAGMVEYMEAAGVPGFLFWPAAIFELLAGIAILVGFKTRLVAFLLAGFCLITAVMFHADFADQMQQTMFLKNLAMAGAFLILMRFGGGEFALDNRAASGDS